jgi:hypothetical protein
VCGAGATHDPAERERIVEGLMKLSDVLGGGRGMKMVREVNLHVTKVAAMPDENGKRVGD